MTTMTMVPATFRSEAALAAAVDAAFADALAEELQAALTDQPAPEPQPEPQPGRPFDLPDVDTLIAQAGIVTGPCPPDPRIPSPTAITAKKAGRLAGQATGWILKATGIALKETADLAWYFIAGDSTSQPQAQPKPDPRQMRPSDFLEATSAEIKEHGWTRWQLENSHGEVCVYGAERNLVRSGTGTWKTARRANTHLRQHLGTRAPVPYWNDWLAAREEQVHAALLNAAARARAAGE